LRAVHAVINAGAGGGVDVFRIGGIDDDAHDVGVVNHAFLNGEPVFAAVGGFPGEMIGAGVNCVFIFGVEGYGVEVAKIFVFRWRDQGPGCAFIEGAIHAG